MSLPPPPAPRWTLGDRLRKARMHAGLKQTELALTTGISRAAIVSYESGRTYPSRPVLLAWSVATEVPIDWLIGDDEEGPEDDGPFRKGRILTLPATA